MNSGPHPDCPEEKVLQEIAAEARPADAYAETVLHHAAQCPHCGPILSRYLQEFSDEPVAELQALNKNEEPAWQNSLARELANKSRPKEAGLVPQGQSGKVVRFPVWARVTAMAAPIAAVIVLAIFLGPGLYAKLDFKKTDKLIAADYAKNRHTLMRPDNVPYGAYKPEIHELGSDANSLGLNRPDLAKANGILADHQNTNDPKWTRQEGRIALLKGADGLKQAEDAFERAKAEGMNDPGLEIDLAVTYFERDSRSDNPNLAQTIDLLNHVLKNPKLTAEQRNTALFDLAIAYEKSNMLDMAADTWAEYLKADTNTAGGWYKEAQQHLNDLKKKLPPPRAADFRQPGYLLRHLDDPEVQNDIEQFQDFALAHWLPDAFKNPGSDSARAIHAIADLMEKQHGDTWWRDFLRSTTAQDLPAIEAASAAFLSSDNDLHFQALEQAQWAATLFRARKNVPGELMANFAEVYALQRSLASARCLAHAEALGARLRKNTYSWLDGQTTLEKAICANIASDRASSDRELALAFEAADRYKLPELRLRAIGMKAGFLRSRKEWRAFWKTVHEGLEAYWERTYSTERLYQFYTVVRLTASSDTPAAAEAILRHSMKLLQDDAPNDVILRATFRRRLAALLYDQKQEARAEAEAESSAALLSQVAENERTGQSYFAIATLALAELQLRHGEPKAALRTISPLSGVLQVQPDVVKLDFYRILGSTYFQLGRISEASSNLAVALGIADQGATKVAEDEERLSWVRATEDIYRTKVEVLLSQGHDSAALALWEWSKTRTVGTTGPNYMLVNSPDVSSLENLRVKTIVYASFPDHLQIWIVDGGRVESRQVEIKAVDLSRMIRQFSDACSSWQDKAVANTDSLGTQLYAVLFEPVGRLVKEGERIALEVDDNLAGIPFEALKSPEGWYLDDRFTISYTPGIQVEEHLHASHPFTKGDRLLLADGSTSGAGYLPGHEALVKVANQLPGGQVVFTAQQTPSSLTARFRSTRSVIFFGHARRYDSGAALELRPGVLLKPEDLGRPDLGALDIVVLAACSSGAADSGLFDSRSLVRAFLNRRVPVVIASRWNVDAASTALLMEKFLTNVVNQPPAMALQKARAEMRALHPNPYFWASFNMTGKDSQQAVLSQ